MSKKRKHPPHPSRQADPDQAATNEIEDNDPPRPRRFDDESGRSWLVTITIGTAKSVRDELDVDLLSTDTEKTMIDLARDPITLCGVLWVLVADQARDAGVSNAEFWDAIADETIEEATFAFLNALIDFFPRRRRGVLRNLIAALKNAGEKQLEAVERRMNGGTIANVIENETTKAIKRLDDVLTSGN